MIHGKDDTVAVGVAIACYLIYSGTCDNFLDALDMYLQCRHPKWKMDATALPASYRRALINFHSIRTLPNFSSQNADSSLFLNCIFVYNLPILKKASSQDDVSSSRPVPRLEIFKGMKTIFSSSWDKESIMEWVRNFSVLVLFSITPTYTQFHTDSRRREISDSSHGRHQRRCGCRVLQR